MKSPTRPARRRTCRSFQLESLETRALLSASIIPTDPTFLAPGPQSPQSALLACPVSSSSSDPFVIYRSTDRNTFTKLAILPATRTLYTDSTLAPNTRYFYWIRRLADSAPSASATLAAPSGLRNVSPTPAAIRLSWANTDPAVTGYYVLRASNGVDFSPVAQINSANTTSFYDFTAAMGNTYTYAVEAIYPSGNSGVSASVTPPAVAAELTLSAQGFSINAGDVTSEANAYSPSFAGIYGPHPPALADGVLTYSFPGWRVALTPTQDASGIHFTINITNTGSLAATPASFTLLSLHRGSGPALAQRWASSIAGPIVMPQTLPDGTLMAFTLDDPAYPVVAEWGNTANPDNGDVKLMLHFDGGQYTRYDLGLTPVVVQPGGSTTIRGSLRFGPTLESVSQVTNAAWTQAYPYSLQWTDHRLMLRGDMFQYDPTATNPQGFQGGFDINDPANAQKFDDWVMAYAARNIATCNAVNAGTWIEWDLEGRQQGQFDYKGSPQLIDTLNSGWAHTDAAGVKLIDRFFKAFKDAGIHIGVTLRPWTLRLDGSGNIYLDTTISGVASIANQMDYSINRWGLDVFYLDSPEQNQTAAFRAMMQARPSVLLIPEDVPESWLQFSAPMVFNGGNLINWGIVPRTLYGDQAWAVYYHQNLASPTIAGNFRADVAHGATTLLDGWMGANASLQLATTFFPA